MSDETFVQTALHYSPYSSGVVNHNLRLIDWPHGYGDPNTYWESVGPRHTSGPMVLTGSRFEVAATSPAIFARKIDVEATGGASFLQRWDQWMSAKLVVEEVEASENQAEGGETDDPHRSRTPARHGKLSAARRELAASGWQPPIAKPLLQHDATLRSFRPPLSPTEVSEAAVTEGGASPHPVHFGHEDVMELQFLSPSPQFAASSAEEEDRAREQAGDLVHVVFADGSRCSCAPSCGRSAEDLECCREWDVACRPRRRSSRVGGA
jgi:hypothetical protein